MIINYTKRGKPFYDCLAEQDVMACVKYGIDINTSTSNIVIAARVLIEEGVFDKDKVEFQFEGRRLEYDNSGNLEAPDGFCDIIPNLYQRLIMARCKK